MKGMPDDDDDMMMMGGEERSFLQGPLMVRSHAVCMVIAWLFLLNLGSFFARYLKKPPGGAYQWFRYHMWVQIAGTAFCLAGFLSVFLHLASNNETHFEGPHGKAGLLLLTLTLLQPLFGYLAHRQYVVHGISPSAWHRVHWWAGRATLLLAAVTVWLGIDMFFHHVLHEYGATYRPYFWFCFVAVLLAAFLVVLLLESRKLNLVTRARAPQIAAPVRVDGEGNLQEAEGATAAGAVSVLSVPSPTEDWRLWFEWWVLGAYGVVVVAAVLPMLYIAAFVL